MRQVVCASFILSFILLIVPFSAFAQTTKAPKEIRYEAVIRDILDEREVAINGKKQLYQKLEVEITKGREKGKKLKVENGNVAQANARSYKIGDKVFVSISKVAGGRDFVFISDYVRTGPIYLLFAIFAGLAILIGRRQGAASLLGLIISFVIIFGFLLPQILAGQDPVTATIIASLFIVPLTFYLSHGLNKKTTAAVIGTIIALIATGILANIFVEALRLTGTNSDEATFLTSLTGGTINFRGLLLAGIIIGGLGIFDDITISQASIVAELKKVGNLSFWQLYAKGMNVGRDHIASMVNTLVLVYAGAAMPLLLLFVKSPQPFTQIINYEILAEEIARTLIASIGLILAVPCATLIACFLYSQKDK